LSAAVDRDHIAELFAAFGPVRVRRMFGGAGLFVDGVMFAIVDDGVIYLKADEATIPAHKRERGSPFTYVTGTGVHALTSYWRLPARLYDEPEELAEWARRALDIALRAAAAKRPKTQSRPKAGRKDHQT
jgi:DNA transformation protein